MIRDDMKHGWITWIEYALVDGSLTIPLLLGNIPPDPLEAAHPREALVHSEEHLRTLDLLVLYQWHP
jgi:hypothetical protein